MERVAGERCFSAHRPASLKAHAPRRKAVAGPAPDLVPRDVRVLPVPVPFTVPPVNCIHLEGAEPTLFDTGCRDDAGWNALTSQSKAAGIDLSRLARVVVTHAHLDHAGNALRLHELSGCEVWLHHDDADVLREWGRHGPGRNESYDAGLRRAGLPERLLAALARRGREVDELMDAAPVHRALRHGDLFTAGDRVLSVLHTPGHTAGSAIFADREGGLALTGDTILEKITPNALSVRKEESGALARYLETLRALRDAPLGTILPGHGRPFSDHAAVIDRAFRLFAVRRARLLAFLERAGRPLSTWELVEREWPEGQKGQAFLMTSEVQGHLDILAADGLVSVTEPEDRKEGGSAALYVFSK